MTATRRIDHLVLAVNDLDGAARLYESLGFQVGARNRHPWGTENRLVQFRSSFLELITVGEDPALIPDHQPGRFSFGAFVRDYLARREGLAMLVLDSGDAGADAARFAQDGIGPFAPFSFERKGLRPDGTQIHVAFSLAFAMDPRLPDAAFFVCQQHFPEAFWNPAFQNHPNGATNLSCVTLGVPDPASHGDFLRAFTGTPGLEADETGLAIALGNDGQLRVLPHPAGRFTAFGVAVPDLGGVARRLADRDIPFEATQEAITLPADQAFGVAIAFTQQPFP